MRSYPPVTASKPVAKMIRRRDPLDRRFAQIDQTDIVVVVDFVIIGLQRDAAGAETVVGRHEFLGQGRVLDPLADLAGDEIADRFVRLCVDQHVAEIAHPDAEARFVIEFFVKRLPLFRCHLQRPPAVGIMHEAGI